MDPKVLSYLAMGVIVFINGLSVLIKGFKLDRFIEDNKEMKIRDDITRAAITETQKEILKNARENAYMLKECTRTLHRILKELDKKK